MEDIIDTGYTLNKVREILSCASPNPGHLHPAGQTVPPRGSGAGGLAWWLPSRTNSWWAVALTTPRKYRNLPFIGKVVPAKRPGPWAVARQAGRPAIDCLQAASQPTPFLSRDGLIHHRVAMNALEISGLKKTYQGGRSPQRASISPSNRGFLRPARSQQGGQIHHHRRDQLTGQQRVPARVKVFGHDIDTDLELAKSSSVWCPRSSTSASSRR